MLVFRSQFNALNAVREAAWSELVGYNNEQMDPARLLNEK